MQTDARFDALAVEEYEDKRTGEKKSRFYRIGVAFPSKDGDGFNVILGAFPCGGKMLIRKARERDDAGTGGTYRGGR